MCLNVLIKIESSSSPPVSRRAAASEMLPCIIEPVRKAQPLGPQDSGLELAFETALSAICDTATDSDVHERCRTSIESISLGVAVQLGMNKGMTAAEAVVCGCRVFPFGSYRHGVHTTWADLDLLCVGPSHCSREEFMQALAEALAGHSRVQAGSVRPLMEAFVPVLKATWLPSSSGQAPLDVDILYAPLSLPALPPGTEASWLLTDQALQAAGGDARSVASLNGVRVNESLHELLSSKQAGTRFQGTLRALRQWAVARGVYGHQQGYLGGVHLGIIAAMACLLYPAAGLYRTVERALYIVSHWAWPRPMALVRAPPTAELKLGYPVRQWGDPGASAGGSDSDVLPILAPCAPVVNMSYNCNRSSARIIKQEWARAHKILARAGQAQQGTGQGLEQQIQVHVTACLRAALAPAWPSFIARYPLYLALWVSWPGAATAGQGESKAWLEYVQSRVRLLPITVENLPPVKVALGPGPGQAELSFRAHLWPEQQACPTAATSGLVPPHALCCWMVGLDLDVSSTASLPSLPDLVPSLRVELDPACRSFATDVFKGWQGGKMDGRDVSLQALTREQAGELARACGWLSEESASSDAPMGT